MDPLCARVSIMYGRIYIARDEKNKAIDVLMKVIEQDKEMVSETLPIMLLNASNLKVILHVGKPIYVNVSRVIVVPLQSFILPILLKRKEALKPHSYILIAN